VSNIEHRGALVLVGGVVGWLIGRHVGSGAVLTALAVLILGGSILFAILEPVWPLVLIVGVALLGLVADRRHHHRQAAGTR
jgi:hypothetical protein